MASGLISVVLAIRRQYQFVPSEYQYHSIQEAADIISKILIESNDDKDIDTIGRSLKISNLVSKFSIQNYKNNLNNIINSLLKTTGEAIILNKA